MPLGDSAELIEILSNTPVLLRQVTVDLTPEQASRRLAGEPWSPVEIVGHFVDVERRALDRIREINTGSTDPVPPIDEMGMVARGGYQDRALEDVLDEFERLRKERIAGLEALPAEAWSHEFTVAGFDTVTLTQITTHLCNHDVNHIAQIVRLRNSEG